MDVKNKFPTINSSTRLAIIGGCPGDAEVTTGRIFSGSGGQLLERRLGSLNLSLDQCYLGYVCPTTTDIKTLDFHGPEITSGLEALTQDLADYKPNCTLALGPEAFRAMYPDYSEDSDDDGRWGVSKVRGSIYNTGRILPPGYSKFIPTFSPEYLLRTWADMPYFKIDLARAKEEAGYPDHRPTVRQIKIRPTFAEACALLVSLRNTHQTAGFDVEGWNDNVGVTMYSIAVSPTQSVVIPLFIDGRHYWPEHEETIIWKLTADWLQDPNCPKIVTNAMYELFILAWKHRIIVVNIAEDTMIKQWEIYPELKKGLATQISMWTKEPYYKDDRTSTDPDTKLLYSGKDPALSFECSLAQDNALRSNPSGLEHYRFNMSLVPAMGYLQLRGCKFNAETASGHIANTNRELIVLQSELDKHLLPPALAADVLTRKRKSDPYHFNVKSNPQRAWLLYDHLKLKPYARYGRKAPEVVVLKYYMKERLPILKLFLDATTLRTRISDINKLTHDADGRIRSNFNIVGTDTARLSSRESNAMEAEFTKTGILKWENTGTNLQNVTKELRDCFVPDSPEHWFFECDLSGADGWTVAADLAALGHPTMLDDYLAGIKPAKVLLLMLAEHEAGRNPASINHLPREELAARTKAIKFPEGRDEQGRPGDWKYLCMKRVQHGTNYDMQPELLALTIFKDSEGVIDLSVAQAGLYQWLYKLRYNVEARKQDIIRKLAKTGCLTTAGGTTRRFFDLRIPSKPDPAVVRSALSFEPQFNTTYATNLALRNLWYDPENRKSNNSLHIEPLLLVHDAIGGQFRIKHATWATTKIKTYFQNDLTIHGIKIRIPFEGKAGKNWRHCKELEFAG